MKGIVFTEFLDMVEDNFGYEVVDKIITEAQLPHDGIYTKVGTYEHKEIYALVGALSKEVGKDAQELVKFFGRHLFGVFLKAYPVFFTNSKSSFEFLENVHSYIHVEVLKIYPDAELPHFHTETLDNGAMKMIYTSSRKLSSLALGLIESTLEHYQDNYKIATTFIEEDGSKVQFTISI